MNGDQGLFKRWFHFAWRIFLSLCRFALVSGAGLMLDLAIYHALVYLAGVQPGISNFFSALCGITFVYFFSGRFGLHCKRRESSDDERLRRKRNGR